MYMCNTNEPQWDLQEIWALTSTAVLMPKTFKLWLYDLVFDKYCKTCLQYPSLAYVLVYIIFQQHDYDTLFTFFILVTVFGREGAKEEADEQVNREKLGSSRAFFS